MKVLNVLALVALTANLVLNFILIPTKGALGAALASVITQGICALGQWYYCYKVHHIDFSVTHFLKFIGAIIFLYVGGDFLKNEWEFIHALGAYILFALVLFFSLKLVSWKAVKVHLFKK
jgi:O-antigen/teichoic acid export membrane protein